MKKLLLFIVLSINTSVVFSHITNISVMGIGKLGLCTALVFERAGYSVLGLDINQEYVKSINNKTILSPEPHITEYLRTSKNFHATTSLEEALNFSDIYFIIVQTPNGTNEAYDHIHLNTLLEKINRYKITNKHIVICCTVFPGYIDTVAKALLKDCKNITISYNPEFIAQGSIIHDFEYPDVVLIGEGSIEAGNLLESIYKKITKNNPAIARMSPISAEIAKIAANCFITTKIAYANMIADIADVTPGANKHDILAMVGSDSRVGKKCLKPGYGFGGPCFPRDNRALGSYAESIGIAPLIPFAVDQSNQSHADFMSKQLLQQNLPVYVFEDVNYKEKCNVIILEESQKLSVAKNLALAGKRVVIKDRKEVVEQVKNKFTDLFEYEVI